LKLKLQENSLNDMTPEPAKLVNAGTAGTDTDPMESDPDTAARPDPIDEQRGCPPIDWHRAFYNVVVV
jgi:hypothetical protein